MKNEYYLKATQSVCYDRNYGITFPVTIQLDFDSILIKHGATDISWQRQFGWSNQPMVICWQGGNVKEINKSFNAIYLGFIVQERIW